jgi:cytidylate kinase
MINVITVDREYGSGGPAIARKIADRLGWTLWDERLTQEIARLADCDPSALEGREERKDPLYYRLFKAFLRGSFEGNLMAQRLAPLDADRVFRLTQHAVRQAAAIGNAVIVGRGSAYFLKDRPDAYHVFIYAPFEEKVRREREAGRSARRLPNSWRRSTGTARRSSRSTSISTGRSAPSITSWPTPGSATKRRRGRSSVGLRWSTPAEWLAGRYDRPADGVERVTGRPAMSVREFVSLHAEAFGGRRS